MLMLTVPHSSRFINIRLDALRALLSTFEECPELAHFITGKSIKTIEAARKTLDTRRTSARDIAEVWKYVENIVKKIEAYQSTSSTTGENREAFVEPALPSISSKGKGAEAKQQDTQVGDDR